MRLFIAVTLEREIKDKLCAMAKSLAESSLTGSFTRRENMHLTLSFIGETSRLSAVKAALDSIKAQPFSLMIGGAGRFRRNDGDIWWAGARLDPTLVDIQRQLTAALRERGFGVEDKEFTPHLTLGRRIHLRPDFDRAAFTASIPVMEMPVRKISLMKSEFAGGRLVYTEIYAKNL
ncbi:RNA 2',3'-cyclic phosphodiesterase [Zongyangia hominis]|uniref:RNA 2',3'-cyclic phosphodiesterase n=1 Tax=Zongyangia hominis TaxID=2763677 RepID=A0A926EC23_9FIRM|nr:RNA 2',3'-cyclic phosphodiesterase [Zongyangia hominis]MBC8570308.1 RNA 2',3'-cyclic phosphodiesterase [Zongyangia hominis]